MNKRIRMMRKALPSFNANAYFNTHEQTQIPIGVFCRWLRIGVNNRDKEKG